MQPRHTTAIPHPGPLRIATEVPWINAAVYDAARRWVASRFRADPVFVHAADGDIVVDVGDVLWGTHYQIRRTRRAIAPVVTLGTHVADVSRSTQVQVLAQALGVAMGLPLDNPRTPPTILSRLPSTIADVTRASSTGRERAAFKRRLRLHRLEQIRLNEATPVVAADGRLLEYKF